jgi:phosphoribosyl-ATP pyrophosphohydrolase/phosphoribosyl-AMP cyclohydrolase
MPKQTISKQTKPQEIDFDKMQGLLPAIVQDAASGDVLMLGFMNREAFEQTMRVGYVTFFSRSRNQLWTKGETSGNRLEVISASTDCDRDTVLLQVRVQGEGLVCHNGTRSCFTESLPVTKQPVQAEGSLP